MKNNYLYHKKETTLQRAWILSLLGLVAVSFAYYVGESNTIHADFLRRGVEFLSLLGSWIVFLIISKKSLSSSAGKKLESFSSIFIALVMFISFIFISYNAYKEFIEPSETGWLLPGIIVALVALVNNSYFWRKYNKIVKEESTQIIESQRRLYRSKALGDIVVFLTLISTVLLGAYDWHQYIDPAGSVLIALFILFSALKILKEAVGSLNDSDNNNSNK